MVGLSIVYTYHPCPVLGDHGGPGGTDVILDSPETEEQLLIPLRAQKQSVPQEPPEDFDPTYMDPDKIQVELEVGPSVLCLYGSLLRNLWHIKVGSM